MRRRELLGFLGGVAAVWPLVVAAESQTEKPRLVTTGAKKFTASAYNLTLEGYYLIVEAGKEKGIFLNNGLDPEWVTKQGRAITASDLKDLLSHGTQIGFSSPSEILLARTEGLPIKIVAGYIGETLIRVYSRANGPVRVAADLNGRKIGSTSAAAQRQIPYISGKFGIQAEAIPFSNLDNNLIALRQGAIDAIVTAEARALALVDQGDLRILLRGSDFRPNPELNNAIWAADDLIRRNPDLVRAFVKATLETVQFLKDNPHYAAGLIIKKTQMAGDVADKFTSLLDWMPSGQPGGDLILAARNYWQVLEAMGALRPSADLKINEVTDTSFVQQP